MNVSTKTAFADDVVKTRGEDDNPLRAFLGRGVEKGVRRQMNEFLIGMQGETVVFMRPVPQQLTRQQAITLAAWLTVIADPGGRLVREMVWDIES